MLRALGWDTVRLPLDIETTYKGHQLTARIEADGNVTWNGATCDSLSSAGGMARKSIVGAPPDREYPPTNGWTFWRFARGHLLSRVATVVAAVIANDPSRKTGRGRFTLRIW